MAGKRLNTILIIVEKKGWKTAKYYFDSSANSY